jgi:hypothetical protein
LKSYVDRALQPRWGALAPLALVVVLLAAAPASAASHRLTTAIVDPDAFTAPNGDAEVAFTRTRGAGAAMVRLWIPWYEVAPNEPSGIATDPGNPAYDWTKVDLQLERARASGVELEPLVMIMGSPQWARDTAAAQTANTTWPNPTDFGQFAAAAAERYRGDFDPDGPDGPRQPLPRVRFWQVWNEPNLLQFFTPQFVNGEHAAPIHYRRLVNSMASAVHSVRADNVVVAGGLAPFGKPGQPAPMRFARKMLCMSRDNKPVSGCGNPPQFDVWSQHPYAPGGPNYDAYWPDDVSIRDLPRMTSLVNAAARVGHVRSSSNTSISRVPLWVTEFSWDTRGPDPKAVPLSLHSRWTAEALYRMWSGGVSLVTWFSIRDRPFPQSRFQSGFYYCGAAGLADESSCQTAGFAGDARKSKSLRAFRFPFVAFAGNGRISVWGRLPPGTTGSVRIERKTAAGWKRVRTLTPTIHGIFSRRWSSRTTAGQFRARAATGEVSVPFSLKRPRPRYYSSFGCGGEIAC